MDVFLSHSSEDAVFVQRLATALEAGGFTALAARRRH
jgi:hypothetical protein